MRTGSLALLLVLCVGCAGDESGAVPATTVAQTVAPAATTSPRVLLEFRAYPGARRVQATARNHVYELPEGAAGALVQLHYERQFERWEHRDEQSGRHLEGHRVFIDYFWRDGRCVWLDIGVGAEGVGIRAERTMSIWTAAGPRSSCV